MSMVSLINSIHNCHMLFRKAGVPVEDLSGRHQTFIYIACETPGLSQDAIAKEQHLDKSTVARALCKLEQNGYVERKSNPKDNRELLIYPTEKALAIFTQVKRTAKAWAKNLTQNISKEEIEVFNSALERMHKNAILAVDSIKEL